MMNSRFINRDQRGFTLVELMVGLVVGIIVIGGSLAMFLATLQNSSHTLRASKLNQDLTAVMQLMVNEVRRASYSSDSTDSLAFDTANNCFIYSYDDDQDDSTDPRKKGFKLRSGVLVMKNDPNSCASISSGDPLTDNNSMTVTNFVIDVTNFRCVNVQESTVMAGCSTAGMASGDMYVTIREVQISITGRSTNYATDNIESTITESVRIRNDLVTTI